MKLDLRLFREGMAARGLLILIVLAGAAGGVLVIRQAWLLSQLIQGAFLQGLTRDELEPLFVGLLVVVLARGLVILSGEASAGLLALRIKARLRSALVDHITELGPVYAAGERSAELSSTIIEGIEALDAYFSQYLPQLALAAMIPLSILLAVFPVDNLSALIFMITAPLIPIFMVLIGKGAEVVTRQQWSALSRMSAFFLDTAQGLKELKLWGQSQNQAARIENVAETYRRTTISVLRVTFLSALVLELVATISTAIIAVQIGLRLLYGQMIFADAFFVLLLAPEFYLPLRLLGQRFHAGMNGVAAAKRIFTILEQDPSANRSPGSGTVALNASLERIEIREVSFSYPQRERLVLDQVSLDIQAGETVALVGDSGSGKTTLVQLLIGFIHPKCGEIRINGHSLQGIDPHIWRSQVAWLPQFPYIFNTSLRENLVLAKTDASEEDIWRAMRCAHLESVVKRLPNGLDTVLGEGGARLSSGEIQRLALARIFLKDAPLLLLDEPTAHLDAEQETVLEDAMRRLCRGRTAVIIAHRLPTIMRADRIVVLNNGRIAEQGSHSDLIAQNGVYVSLVRAYGGVG